MAPVQNNNGTKQKLWEPVEQEERESAKEDSMKIPSILVGQLGDPGEEKCFST